MAPTSCEKDKPINHSDPRPAATWVKRQRHICFHPEEKMAGGWPTERKGGAATCLRAADLRPRLQITAAPDGEAAAGAAGPFEIRSLIHIRSCRRIEGGRDTWHPDEYKKK